MIHYVLFIILTIIVFKGVFYNLKDFYKKLIITVTKFHG